MGAKYQEQWERTKRWFNLFKEINDGKPHTKPSDYNDDVVYAFFMNCFHLKDWIKHDHMISPKQKVEDFIRNNDSMQKCGDITNGIKHLTLTFHHSPKDPKFGPKNITLTVGPEEPIIKTKYVITTNIGTEDAFQLASDCVKEWENYIKANL